MNRREFLAAAAAALAPLACSIRVRLFISGTVQGVSYRASTQEQARKREVVGWVRNLEDGRVEALAQGSKDKVEELVAWCRRGPPAAKVEKVVVTFEDVNDEFKTFEVRY
ncbi:MAG TPA: acylphosphatase [Planctomycetota bacterium]|nr:acylphosphatase [Planctomycetota bacterium]